MPGSLASCWKLRRIHPHEVTETCLVADEAEVHGDVVFTRREKDAGGPACRWIAIAIGGISAQLICGTEKFAIRQSRRHTNGVGAWIEIQKL